LPEGLAQRLESMLASGQDNALLRFGLGNHYFNEKAYDEALPHLQALIAQDPGHSAGWKLLGRSYQALGQLDDARRAFEQGLQVAEANGDKQVVREITVFLRKLKRSDEA
jgi:predicted Zn-dependent protease